MAERSKVIDIPEEQFLGALERAVGLLAEDVEGLLRGLEQGRGLRERADEVIERLGPSRRRRRTATPKSR